MDYDVIGDIHGQADKLHRLLTRMGYRVSQNAWRHSQRMAIFVGDLIDRGAKGVETVSTVRAMVEAGSALAVMGNHELNAIAWHTPDPRHPGDYLRPRFRQPWADKNRAQHQAFLKQVEALPALHTELVEWFIGLPLWLELEGLRVVHACWHAPLMNWLASQLHEGRFLTRELLADATTEPDDPAEKDSPSPSLFKAVEALTKGIEAQLPAPHRFRDKDGHQRHRVRVRWWDERATTYREAAMLPEHDRALLPDTALPPHARLPDIGSKPVFFGHYWMSGAQRLLSDSRVCVDYSAGKDGPLVAYRWNQGEPLNERHFVAAT